MGLTADQKIEHFINLLQTRRYNTIVCNGRQVTVDEAVAILKRKLGVWK